eukprot:gb/GEZN01004898.1/.p1 GENE.gb/GEZN01004898.1/~~gb/GEZN01004898.1/.p1  ORF type:complete len:518 (-),score=62.76 gb/GEZN01004898.1/:328-1830(-)
MEVNIPLLAEEETPQSTTSKLLGKLREGVEHVRHSKQRNWFVATGVLSLVLFILIIVYAAKSGKKSRMQEETAQRERDSRIPDAVPTIPPSVLASTAIPPSSLDKLREQTESMTHIAQVLQDNQEEIWEMWEDVREEHEELIVEAQKAKENAANDGKGGMGGVANKAAKAAKAGKEAKQNAGGVGTESGDLCGSADTPCCEGTVPGNACNHSGVCLGGAQVPGIPLNFCAPCGEVGNPCCAGEAAGSACVPDGVNKSVCVTLSGIFVVEAINKKVQSLSASFAGKVSTLAKAQGDNGVPHGLGDFQPTSFNWPFCMPCGTPLMPCCEDGCDDGLDCLVMPTFSTGLCGTCGEPYSFCCNQNSCNPGSSCVNLTSPGSNQFMPFCMPIPQCGNVSEICCTGPGAQCADGLACVTVSNVNNQGDTMSVCTPCGSEFLSCCPGDSCDPSLACTSVTADSTTFKVCTACGGDGNACCTTTGAECQTGLDCTPLINNGVTLNICH